MNTFILLQIKRNTNDKKPNNMPYYNYKKEIIFAISFVI